VWERDDFTCRHCGSRKHLTVDHIHPESKGGKMTMDNAQTLCRSCNSRKGAR
jgi:5-methylcytosine-specific restriction endonuclease McrA